MSLERKDVRAKLDPDTHAALTCERLGISGNRRESAGKTGRGRA